MSNHHNAPRARRMKATFPILALPIAVGLAVWLALERQAVLKLSQENDGLRQRLSQMDELSAENQRLSSLVMASKRSAGGDASTPREALATDEPSDELTRLRSEAQALREQGKEIEKLQANTREVRVSAETALKSKNVPRAAGGTIASAGNGSQLEVVAANYWTDNTNLDVSDALRDRIRGDSLKAIASNNLKGDPEFGQVKHLTVVYRFGGVTMTNEFREGEVVVLPKPEGPQ